MTKQTVTQFSVPVENEPGKLYKVSQVLSREGINITGIMTESLGDVAFIRFMADNEQKVHRLLENAGFDAIERRVFQIDLPNKPGELTRVAKALADEDVNILCVYGTADSCETAKVVLVVDHPEKAEPILSRWMEKAYAGAR